MPIYKKLLEFQQKEISVKKVGKNPHFQSKYATINEVLEKVKKPLNELGVLIIQEPMLGGLLTRLIDTEDETQVTGFMPYVEVSTAQKLGSNNTYNRRYSLVTLLGLEDEDDDGHVASFGNSSRKALHTAYKEQGEAIGSEVEQSSGYAQKLASKAQKDLISRLMLERGKKVDPNWLVSVTMQEAKKHIDRLINQPQGEQVVDYDQNEPQR